MSSMDINPVREVRINGKYGFVELRTPEDTSNALNLTGIVFFGIGLRISRPSKFASDNRETKCKFYEWDGLYQSWLSGELRLQTSGPPSNILIITGMASPADLANPVLYHDIILDTRMECSQYGVVLSVVVPRGTGSPSANVFVAMEDSNQARAVLIALKGRTFDDRTVDVKFYPPAEFNAMNYLYTPIPLVITQSHGAVPIDRVLDSAAMARINS